MSKLHFYHRDPFDRLIVSQAMSAEMPIIGKDSKLARYSIELVW